MPRNVIAQQCTSLKTHPHVKKIEIVSNRLIRLNYLPQSCLESVYRLKIELPMNYPEQPPTVKFDDPIDHVNICPQTGLVYQPLLMDQWSPYLSLYIIIDILDTLIAQPETDVKYCVNKHSQSISEIQKKQWRRKSEDINSQYSQINRGLLRMNSRVEFQPSIMTPEFVYEETPVEPTSSKKRVLKRLRSFQCQKPSEYKFLEDKHFFKEESRMSRMKTVEPLKEENHVSCQQTEDIPTEQQQKRRIKLNMLSDIFEDAAEHTSKIYSQLGDSTRNPKISICRPKPIDSSKMTTSRFSEFQIKTSINNQEKDIEKIKQKERSRNLSPMPTLRRMTTMEEEQKDHPSVITTATPTLTKVKVESTRMKNTIFFDNSSYQLDHLNRLLKLFTKEYEQLEQRKKMTTNKQIIQMIEKKIKEHIDMIEELQDLGSSLRQGMVFKVKNIQR